MRATSSDARLPETPHDGVNPAAAWSVGGLMAQAILPDRPAERRKRRRLCDMRAMDRLGLWGEENLIPTLAARPELGWLANEEGARWAVLGQLGRIGDPGTFEEAVAWALQNRPSPEQAGAHIRCLRAGERAARGGDRARRNSASAPSRATAPDTLGP